MGNRNRLRLLRAERRDKAGKGWSQLDVANKAKMPAGRYWRIENGYDKPSPSELNALAEVFGVDASDLFKASEAVAS